MQYIKIPYSRYSDMVANEKKTFQIINGIIKKRNRKIAKNKGFAKEYGFRAHQVKELVSMHMYIKFGDDVTFDPYMRIKKLHIENSIEIIKKLLEEARVNEKEIKAESSVFDDILQIWNRIKNQLESILINETTANIVNRASECAQIATKILDKGKYV